MEVIPEILTLINSLPHSSCRVPYTYHHDYLRSHSVKFAGKSREYVAAHHDSSKNELYCAALCQIAENIDHVTLLQSVPSIEMLKHYLHAVDVTNKMIARIGGHI